jgi:hypothetical protein
MMRNVVCPPRVTTWLSCGSPWAESRMETKRPRDEAAFDELRYRAVNVCGGHQNIDVCRRTFGHIHPRCNAADDRVRDSLEHGIPRPAPGRAVFPKLSKRSRVTSVPAHASKKEGATKAAIRDLRPPRVTRFRVISPCTLHIAYCRFSVEVAKSGSPVAASTCADHRGVNGAPAGLLAPFSPACDTMLMTATGNGSI